MGYSNALPKKPYLPALVSSSLTIRRSSSPVMQLSFSRLMLSSSLTTISAFSERLFCSASFSSSSFTSDGIRKPKGFTSLLISTPLHNDFTV